MQTKQFIIDYLKAKYPSNVPLQMVAADILCDVRQKMLNHVTFDDGSLNNVEIVHVFVTSDVLIVHRLPAILHTVRAEDGPAHNVFSSLSYPANDGNYVVFIGYLTL